MSEEEYSDWEEGDEEEVFEQLPAIPHQVPARRAAYPHLSNRRARKQQYADRLRTLVQNYRNVLILEIDNVGSHQMQKIRIALRGRGILLMGKNTIMRRILREEAKTNPKLEQLIGLVGGNIGFCFCNEDLPTVRKIILKYRVPAGAKTGTNAPDDVWVPAGPTGIDPGQTSFFQVLQIATKISRGAIEVLNDVHIIKKGERVTASAVSLLEKLNIRPFSYGCGISNVYEDGQVYSADVLDLSESDLLNKFFKGARFVAAAGLALGIPNEATLIHNIADRKSVV